MAKSLALKSPAPWSGCLMLRPMPNPRSPCNRAIFSSPSADGVTEPENESGEFGEERLIDLIREHRHQTLSRIGNVITSSVADWIGGAEQPDDMTVVLARAR